MLTSSINDCVISATWVEKLSVSSSRGGDSTSVEADLLDRLRRLLDQGDTALTQPTHDFSGVDQ